MKNKILSYLLGGLFILSTRLIIPYVYAQDCDCPYDDEMCRYKCEAYQSERYEERTTSNEDPSKENETEKKECKDGCCGIKLNTNFPGFGNCISYDKGGKNPTNAFPSMMATLTKLIMSIVLVVCFITIIVAGIMRAGAGEDSSKKTKAKKLIERVAITILLLGFSGVILRLVNPNFFG